MKSRNPKSLIASAIAIAISALLIQSCTKTPTPQFTYEPSVNPEAGDSIFFINGSLDATTYEWDFGDGYSSSDENPSNIYVETGTYDVSLTASNDKKSDMITQTITINDPTVLALYVHEDDGTTPVADVSVWVYDNEYDWENYNDPQFQDFTDNDGFVMFLNLEAQAYIVDVYKETDTGYWRGAYDIPALTLNEIDIYGLTMEFVADGAKKGAAKRSHVSDHRLPVRKIDK